MAANAPDRGRPIVVPKASGNASNIANQDISANGNSRTVTPSAGGGLIKTPAQAQTAASPGSKAKPQRDINQPPVNQALGYEQGGFDDPTIDWQAIYNAMVAPGLGGGGGDSGLGYGGSPSTVMPGASSAAPAPVVFQSPEQISAPAQTQLPAVINGSASGQAGDPTGNAFSAFGSPSSFGGFERQRNQRGPMHNASMTPEMLRRAAATRLG